MERNGEREWGISKKRWKEMKAGEGRVTVKQTMVMLRQNLSSDENDRRPVIPLGHGDPSSFPSFRTPSAAEESVIDSLRSARFNCYATAYGLPPTRRAVAEYISRDLPLELSPEDVLITAGSKQAIQCTVSALAHPDANILLPRPGFAMYDAAATCSQLEVRHYDLLPEKGWEVDLHSVEALADDNTLAIVIINPGNPCGSVYSFRHLEEIAETARRLGLIVISDEVYDKTAFGSNPFVRMAVFASKVPILTLGSISKQWMVPGWRLGWLVATDPNGLLEKYGLLERMKYFLDVSADAPTFVQAALPEMIKKTDEEFYSKTIKVLRQGADIVFEKLKENPYITCPNKPQGSMFAMAKLNESMLGDIKDDIDFCVRLAKEEKVIVLPGSTLGAKNWLRITFALEPSILQDGLERIMAFCERNAKVQ